MKAFFTFVGLALVFALPACSSSSSCPAVPLHCACNVEPVCTSGQWVCNCPDAGGDAAADVAAETAATCKHAGDTCTSADSCNTWSCKCANITNPEITVGSCSGGTCQSGTDACASLCANAGGVTSATDDGC